MKEIVEDTLEHGPKENPTLFMSAVILFSCTVVGPNADRITKFTGYDRDKVRKIARRIRRAGIWCGQGADSAMDIGPWMEEEAGSLAFLLDAMVAGGELKKTGDRYALTQRGIQKGRIRGVLPMK